MNMLFAQEIDGLLARTSPEEEHRKLQSELNFLAWWNLSLVCMEHRGFAQTRDLFANL